MATTRLSRSRRQYVQPPIPGFVEFQHPKLVSTPPSGPGWIHEIKYDGYRMQIRVERGRIAIFTRNGFDWTERLPELAEDAAGLENCILDGELCALEAEGRSTFSGLRAALSPGKTVGLVYFAFDCLYAGGEDLRPYALEARKSVLARLLDDAPARLRWVDSFGIGGEALLLSACNLQLEGIVSKRLDAPYRAGRGDAWVKTKCRPSQELVIGGWKQAPGAHFEGLLVGVYDQGRLRYAGRLKSGFGRSAGLLAKLQALEIDHAPFETGDAPRPASNLHWVKPKLVASAEIAEWTASGMLRQATFKGLREDKDPTSVVREFPTG